MRIETVTLVGPGGRQKIVNAGSEREADLRKSGWSDPSTSAGKAPAKPEPAEESAGKGGAGASGKPAGRGRRS